MQTIERTLYTFWVVGKTYDQREKKPSAGIIFDVTTQSLKAKSSTKFNKMTQSELLVFVIERLTQTQTPYMVTGSVVSSLQGEPRSTHDIDIVIVLQVQHVASFAQHFPKDQFYIDEDAAKDAIRYHSMFNVIDMHSGNKLDFWLLSTEEYDLVRFARRQKVQIAGFEDFYVTTPEDTILSKLKWAKMAGGSEKQLTDATRVYETQYEKLDIAYIENWVLVLHLQKEWQILKDQAEHYI